MASPQIRKARPGDEAGIHEAHMRSIREICVKDHGEDEVRGWGNRPLNNRWTDTIQSGHVWVIEHEERICGQAYIRIFEENNQKLAHIMGLYITPEVSGKGLGYALAQNMIQAARDARVTQITLESTITAHRFYERLGFVDTGPMGKAEIGGGLVSHFPMKMQL